MSHYEEKIDSKEVFRGKIISVRHDTVRIENGKEKLREMVCHPGAVVVLACENGFAYFVRQYRYCAAQEMLEAPAGKLEEGEEPEKAALRELKEETGLSCSRLVYLGQVYPSPGVYGEMLHMYFAGGLTYGEQCPDEDEFVTCERLSLADFDKLLAQGDIKDAKTICIVAMARSRGLI